MKHPYDIILVVAYLPIPAIQSSQEFVLTPEQEAIAEYIALGWPPSRIAYQLAPKDAKKRKVIRQRVRRITNNEAAVKYLAEAYQAESFLGMGAAIQALVKRASRGNVPAIKLLGEFSGWFEPRKASVEHSGEIQITIKGANRPERQVEEFIGEAEVIE